MPVEVSDEMSVELEKLGVRRGSYVLEPLSKMQKVIATRLTEAARDVPTFPLSLDLDIDALLAARAAHNSANSARVSVNDLLIRACALALKEVPAVNSSYTPFGFVRHNQVEIAIAVATDLGLVTPVIRAVETKNIAQIAAEARDLSERARARRLRGDEYIGGTFTISNLGMFGIKSFGSIINPPHGAILSVGAGQPTAVVTESGEFRAATLMNVTLTCDHRVIDGAIGAKWLKAFRQFVEQPQKLFA